MRSLVFAIVLVTSAATPTAAPRQHQQSTPEQKKGMAERGQPGAPHRELAALEGRWTQEVTYNTGAIPMKGCGTTPNRMIDELGDALLFLEMEPSAQGVRATFWLSTYGLSAAGWRTRALDTKRCIGTHCRRR